MGILNRLDARGHGPIATWSEDRRSQAKAAAAFADHLTKRYKMYDISAGTLAATNGLGRKIDTFDPAAAEILAVPQLVGG